MPIYEFKCSTDGIVEKFFSMDDAPPVGVEIVCPICGGQAKRILSGVSTDLKENPRLSRALAVPVDWLKDGTANKIHPNADFVVNKGVAIPVIHNRKEKLKRIKERSKYTGQDWVEY